MTRRLRAPISPPRRTLFRGSRTLVGAKPLSFEENTGLTIVRAHSFARAALIGNPSDCHHGRTIAAIVKNFAATAELRESALLELPLDEDRPRRFESLDHFMKDVFQRLQRRFEALQCAVIKSICA